MQCSLSHSATAFGDTDNENRARARQQCQKRWYYDGRAGRSSGERTMLLILHPRERERERSTQHATAEHTSQLSLSLSLSIHRPLCSGSDIWPGKCVSKGPYVCALMVAWQRRSRWRQIYCFLLCELDRSAVLTSCAHGFCTTHAGETQRWIELMSRK